MRDREFQDGDQVVITADNLDGSWEGAEGRIVHAEWNNGGLFAGPRWIYYILLDEEDDGQDEAEIKRMIEDGEGLHTSDDFEIEHA